MWWPREIWGQYATSLDAFKQADEAQAAVHCLNDMVRPPGCLATAGPAWLGAACLPATRFPVLRVWRLLTTRW